MSNPIFRRAPLAVFLGSVALSGSWIFSHRGAAAPIAIQSAGKEASRPQYRIEARIDYDLLTLNSSAQVTIPVAPGDSMHDAVFFLYANADGVGGDDARRKNLVVDQVSLGKQSAPLPFKLDGAVLKVDLGQPQTADFTLVIKYHGVVPRGAAQDGGLSAMMGGALGGDISSLLGIGDKKSAPAKPKNTDYGLYTYGNGILSLGSFWYPALAVRRAGKWAADAPEGLGDVAFAEKSDFEVEIRAPKGLVLVAPGQIATSSSGNETVFRAKAPDAREFAVLLSEDFVQKSRDFAIADKNVTVSATVLRPNAGKLDQTLDVAGHALQIFSKRFGNYPFSEFKIVEAPMKGGAGGMEYSRMIGIASMLYGDMGAQLGGLTSSLQIPGADKLLESLGDDTLSAGASVPATKNEEASEGNPMTDMVGGILGQQKQIFDSILETTIAHEVAHQWWAIGVGSDSQKHPFVDESLTNWSAMLYFEDRYGAQKAAQMRDLHLKTSFSMGAMLGGGDKRADLPTSAYTNNLQYGAVIYGKGALFYDEMRKLLGDASFFVALRNYYATWNDKIADEKSLRNLFIAASPAKRTSIDALYKRWIEEAHGSEDIGGGAMNLDLGGMLGGLLGANAGESE
ncbi:hypothetical protein B1R32_10292 [Abditibacterium utsteinense]|uniref:Peptidase M1 membrane alanine aminopeptidase domain-containing protein n=1 Tax=Abditibacterium utsteinense TaxID=1960156 RepID=A0A2S8SWB3_9BACT|nr:M1 family aminopeptidase [Abditibacterium utsteinense]PQV65085.1 hypothetical protein B1R32_10292 [Abditibacterium utsteinense]